ncbi:MAG: kinase [Bacteroidetes bacterium]|nr:kinase [Bacteroidota bacterium]
MIISKTPLRISFFGGGTDYPDYVFKHGGMVLSTTIDKYIYITLDKINPLSEVKYKIAYSKLESCNTLDEIQHPSVRECLRFVGITEGIEIHIMNDLPAKTGLGASSTFTVGLLNALYTYTNKKVSKEQLAKDAIYVEQKLIGEKVGLQDQAAAAIGGFNKITFEQNGDIKSTPLNLDQSKSNELQNNLLLFYTGVQRFAEDILNEQISKTKEGSINTDLSAIKHMVDKGHQLLTQNQHANFGKLLHEAWISKKKLSSAISSNALDNMYDLAMQAGALGGKLLGAGGGGFFVFYVEPKNHAQVRTALKEYQEIPFRFDTHGSQIIYQ